MGNWTEDENAMKISSQSSSDESEIIDDLYTLEYMKNLVKDEGRAIKVVFCLSGGREVTYWVDTNKNLLPFIRAEIRTLSGQVEEKGGSRG